MHQPKRGGSKRDKWEREYLALAQERSDAVKNYDTKLIALQRRIEQREQKGDKLHQLSEQLTDHHPDDSSTDTPHHHPDEPTHDLDERDKESCSYSLWLLISMLDLISKSKQNPRLAAHACLLALGVKSRSMWYIARQEQVSREAIRQRTSKMRSLFSLPHNQHHKSSQVLARYAPLRLLHPALQRTKQQRDTQPTPNNKIVLMTPGGDAMQA